MARWSILRRISAYGGSFTYSSSKHMVFPPIDLTRSLSFSLIHTSADDELLLQRILTHHGTASKFIGKNDITGLVEKYLRSGNISDAHSLLQSLPDRKFFLPDAQERVLRAAAEKGDFEISCRVFRQLLSGGEPLSSECYLNLARAFMETDDCTHLFRLLKEVAESSTRTNGLTVINRTLLAFAESRQIDKVLLMLDQMKGWECKPDLITCNTVLDILGRAGNLNEMLRLFSSMKEDGLVPDIITYNTLFNGFKKAGRLDLCTIYYEEMHRSGIQPDLLTYTAVIDSFGRSGNIEDSLRLFDEMKQRKISPSLYIYRALIDSLKKSGNLLKAMQLSDEMNSSSPADLARPEDFKRTRKTCRR
ncbi:PREDICTED: pentatricopeptide repeat-containing protein At1g11900 [Tarenaya hassleriana]|uniref:pentatricopeptide repeat-containing protein At1g11900 n=1 Tax=Tarenaya hassleriana TaxID=28532 RepID=UPI00053C1528|nr:PREDICTED: pentatricopeptide repeat-containing protein At1g11900 [Tarenaya hassleriana]